jgi:hypothetical protein
MRVIPPPMQAPLPTYAPLPWQAIHGVRQSIIYADKDTSVCATRRKVGFGVAEANANFIVHACNHHHELLRIVRCAASILADDGEFPWPDSDVARVLAQEFCRQAADVLRRAERDYW